MSSKRYKGLLAFQACDKLVLAVYSATQRWPSHERFGLTSQARRSAFSTAANIAEGCGKRGYREFRRYLDISLGSLSELSYTLSLAHRLGYVSDQEYTDLNQLNEKAGRLTFCLARSIDRRAK